MLGLDFPADSSIVAYTARERPDLWEVARSSFAGVWPEYNLHANDSAKYFGTLFARHAHLQVLFFDRATETVVARGRTIPFRWDGSLEDLPTGIDAVGLRAVDDSRSPTALSALAAEVAMDRQGQGLSRLIIQAMAECGPSGGARTTRGPRSPQLEGSLPPHTYRSLRVLEAGRRPAV